MSVCREGESSPEGCDGRVIRGVAGALKGVVVAVLGLAELVEKEDDGLQAQDQHDSPDEARGVKRVGARLARGDDCRGAGVGRSCRVATRQS